MISKLYCTYRKSHAAMSLLSVKKKKAKGKKERKKGKSKKNINTNIHYSKTNKTKNNINNIYKPCCTDIGGDTIRHLLRMIKR